MSVRTQPQAQDELTGHVYDGIQEYDNPMPRWWAMIFVASIVFAFFYWGIVTLAGGELSPEAELKGDKMQETIQQFGSLGELKPDAATLARFAADPKWNAVGQSIFLSKCAACHNRDASGINGTNLTDDFYIHVRHIEDIAQVITNGANQGAMPSWRSTMSQNEIIMVASYVSSLRGQNRPGKAPEPNAVKIDPWQH